METSNYLPPIAFHPGETLAEKLSELNMSIKEFALRASKPEKTIHAVIKGESSVTPDMAIAFESVTKIPASFWLNKQRRYDEYKARIRQEAVMNQACEWARLFPYSKMVELGWIMAYRHINEKAKELLSFFQVSSPKGWEDYYLHQKLKIAFRISLANSKDPHAISAWLRQGEIQASNIVVNDYSEKELRLAIVSLKNIMIIQPSDFAKQAQSICAKAGVKLIYTPCLPKAPIGGSTRWINNIPVIQLSGRHNRYDIFWFNLFHKIGHILLHGKKEIFLDDYENNEYDKQKEIEANNFAANILLAPKDEARILDNGSHSYEIIQDYAKEFNTHPAIIIGRLQHLHIISYNQYKDLIPKVNLFI